MGDDQMVNRVDMPEHIVDGIFHARLTSKRESKSGIFLTIQLTPDDFSPALAQLRAGSLLKMGWQELIDTEVHKIELGRSDEQSPTREATAIGTTTQSTPRTSKPKKRFEDMQLSQQAGMRCDDANFRAFLTEAYGFADEATAAGVRLICCNIRSRSELDTNLTAADVWKTLEREYQNWLTDQRHAESIRR